MAKRSLIDALAPRSRRAALFVLGLVVATGCRLHAQPQAAFDRAPIVSARAPAPERADEWEEAPVEAILRETARRSCLQDARCRSYNCMPIGALTEGCHPARVEPRIARATGALERGEVRFDRARALSVLGELEASGSCRDQRRSAACDRGIDRTFEAIVGARGLGERCSESYECKSARCAFDELGRGVCGAGIDARRPLADGDHRCERSADCLPGRICSQEEGCAVPIEAGQPCGAHLGPSRLSACADGLVCMAAGCGPGTDVGGACSNDGTMDPCRHGTECRDGRCVVVGPPWGPCGTGGHCPESFHCPQGRCEPLPRIGEPCAGECVDGACAHGLCAPVEVGDRCVGEVFGGRACVEGARCDQRADRCVAR